jgi:hypothetical protein
VTSTCPPAAAGDFVRVWRVWTAHGTSVVGILLFNARTWAEHTSISLELTDPDGNLIGSRSFKRDGGQGEHLEAAAAKTG